MTNLNDAQRLLVAVINQFLTSGDFNGYPAGIGQPDLLEPARELLAEELVEVIDQEDYPNPHIRPWLGRRRIEDQKRRLIKAFNKGEYVCCLYPTAKAMTTHLEAGFAADQPFAARMAECKAARLDCAFFRLDVLESYRNDPRFDFTFQDFGVQFSITEEAWLAHGGADFDDDVGLGYGGFAYEFGDDGAPSDRAVCCFVGDLSKLTPAHQQRWRSYEVLGDNFHPHPMWFGQMMGHWADGIGDFTRLMVELRSWNELFESAYGEPLFGDLERPRELGWVLRASQREYDEFVQLLNVLIVDNMRHKGFDAAGVSRRDADEQLVGTLTRLDWLLESCKVSTEQRQHFLGPLRRIRRERQSPAHRVIENLSDDAVFHKQIELLDDLLQVIGPLRIFWQAHPSNLMWEEPEVLSLKRYRI